jgi:hypothetical protein
LQTFAKQSLLAGQSVEATQATHLPVFASQTLPSTEAAQSRLFLHGATGVTQAWASHFLPVSQSRSAMHSKQLLAAGSHTFPAGQSRLVLHPSGGVPASDIVTTVPASLVDASVSATKPPKAELPPHPTANSDTNDKHNPSAACLCIRFSPFK